MGDFEQSLKQGAKGEDLIARWILKCDDVSQVIKHCQNGAQGAPMMRLKGGELAILPDLEVIQANGERVWVECKTYDGPAYNRGRRMWVHGIHEHQARAYQKVADETRSSVFVWILALRDCSLRSISLKRVFDDSWACECWNCKERNACKNKRPMIYFPLSSTRKVHTFERAELVEIDRAQAENRHLIFRPNRSA